MIYPLVFLEALATTLSIELGAGLIVRWAGSRFNKLKWMHIAKSISLSKFIIGVLLASILTLPYVWFVFPVLLKSRLAFGTVSEFFAFSVEALFYYFFFGFSWKFSLFFSFLLNFCSFSIGLSFF